MRVRVLFVLFIIFGLSTCSPVDANGCVKEGRERSERKPEIVEKMSVIIGVFVFFSLIFLAITKNYPPRERKSCIPVYFVYIIAMVFIFGVLPVLGMESEEMRQNETKINSVKSTYWERINKERRERIHQITSPPLFPHLSFNTTNTSTSTITPVEEERDVNGTQPMTNATSCAAALADIQVGPDRIFPEFPTENLTEFYLLLGLIIVALSLLLIGCCVVKSFCR
jgi:hypothetical protein